MLLVPIQSLDDPRVAPYGNLKDRDLSSQSSGDRFIAEGEQVVKRLIASRFEVESILAAENRVDRIINVAPPTVPLYVAPSDVVNGVLGFKFHSGILAVGRRGRRLTLDEIIPAADRAATLLVCPEIANTENLGSLIRIAAAFGVDAMILGERSCDPFFRQSIRVSMGAVFSLPIYQSKDLLLDLETMKSGHAIELIATVLDDGARPLDTFKRKSRSAILLGNEAQGLTAAQVEACDCRVTIPMKLGTDSLNVAIAAAVFLYELTRDPR